MSDESAVDTQAIFDQYIENGKDAVILALVQSGGLTVTNAVREYQKLAKDKGIILGAKDREKKIYGQLEELDAEVIKDDDKRRELIQELADQYDVSPATITVHVKDFCKENDIDLPIQERTSLDTVVDFAKELLDQEISRKEVIEAMQDKFNYTANTAASTFTRVAKALGISEGRTGPKVELSEVVKFMRENESLPRKVAIEKMHEELGYSESTAGSFYTYLNMAKEYSRQEMEALGIEQDEAAA